jgi:uridine kinase
LVGIVGVPGSGKTTFGRLLAASLDADILAMDGYHFSVADLKKYSGNSGVFYHFSVADLKKYS